MKEPENIETQTQAPTDTQTAPAPPAAVETGPRDTEAGALAALGVDADTAAELEALGRKVMADGKLGDFLTKIGAPAAAGDEAGGEHADPEAAGAAGMAALLGIKPGDLPPEMLIGLLVALFGAKLPADYRARWLEAMQQNVVPWLHFLRWDEVCGALDPERIPPAVRLVLCLAIIAGSMWATGRSLAAELAAERGEPAPEPAPKRRRGFMARLSGAA